MSDQNLTIKTQVKLLLEEQEIQPANLEEFNLKKEENKAFLQHNSVENTKKEVSFIDRILSGEYKEDELNLPEKLKLKLTEEDRVALQNRKTMGLANLLLNNNTKEDSKEMTNVKIDLVNLSKIMEEVRNLPPTEENMDKVDVAFKMAIDSCNYYCNNKNPWFSAGVKRKKMVREVAMSLTAESEVFVFRKNALLKNRNQAEAPRTIGEIFGMKAGEVIERPKTKKEEKEAAKRANAKPAEQPAQAGKQKEEAKPELKYPEEVKAVRDCFGAGYNFADKIKGKYKNKKDQVAAGNKVRALYDALKQFTPGSVEVADVDVMGKKVKLLQKTNGGLFVIVDHKEYPLERSASTVCMEVESEIFSQTEVFGEDQLRSLLDLYESREYKAKMNSGENNRIRGLLANYLSNKTGLVANEFTNTFRAKMGAYVRSLLDKKKTPEQIRQEVEEHTKNGIFINGVAISEMAELNKNRSGDEIAQIVDMNAQPKVEVIPQGWTKEEQEIKNMISDMIFTADTEKMEIGLSLPGKFLKDVIKNHKSAMDALANAKKNNQNIVGDILKKMCIADLNGEIDGSDVRLADVVEECINSVADLYVGAKDGEVEEAALAEVMQRLDDVVEKSCKIMQKNVGVMTDVIFPQEVEEDEDKTLRQRVAEASKSEAGQGRFMRNVMNTYFAAVNTVDKRAMLAAVFRTAQNVPEDHTTDDDLIDEIQEEAPLRFRSVFADRERQVNPDDPTGDRIYILSDEDRRVLAEYRTYKKTMLTQANFMAGLIRGAGPLMHKMMQGLPVSSLPKPIQEALSDVKSNLQPIPDNLVQSEFLSLVESSNKRLTKIEKIKSLGAASVGETFLCKVYGPAEDLKNGKEVVIKLLRPEAKNRMQREEAVMLKAARDTDEAMYLTYKGQLDNYKKELDLSIEGENCKKGVKSYEGKYKDVETMKVLDGVPSTSTALIVEKAEGITLDKYIKELKNFAVDSMKDMFHKVTYQDGSTALKMEVVFEPRMKKEDMQALIQKLADKKALLIQKIEEAIKRRDHLINLCTLWIDEATMKNPETEGGGFYHGDLHSGNMMINDDKVTFIDYGNTVQLNAAQQRAIERMTIATACSIRQKASKNSVELFFSSFNSLVEENKDPEFLAMYTPAKQAELKQAFEEILALGDEHEAGFRMSLCLIKAQELGVKLPPAIQNFSQGQVRLQNTIDDMNAAIDSIKKGIDVIEKAHSVKSFSYDPLPKVLRKFEDLDEDEAKVSSNAELFKHWVGNLMPVNEEEFKAGLVDTTVIEADLKNGIKFVNKRNDFKHQYLLKFNPAINACDAQRLYDVGFTKEELKSYGFDADDLKKLEERPKIRERVQALYQKYGTGELTKEQKAEMNSEIDKITTAIMPKYSDDFNIFGGSAYIGSLLYDGLNLRKPEAMDKVLEIYEVHIRRLLGMTTKMRNLWKQIDSKKITDDEKKKQVDDIYNDYDQLQSFMSQNDEIISLVNLRMEPYNSEYDMEPELGPLFDIEQDGIGAKLRQQFDEFVKFRKEKTEFNEKTRKEKWLGTPEEEEHKKQLQKEFIKTYTKACSIRLKDYYDKIYSKEASVKFKDYDTVMEEVVTKHFNLNGTIAALKSLNKVRETLGFDTATVLTMAMLD